jgi:hypothetical protein
MISRPVLLVIALIVIASDVHDEYTETKVDNHSRLLSTIVVLKQTECVLPHQNLKCQLAIA